MEFIISENLYVIMQNKESGGDFLSSLGITLLLLLLLNQKLTYFYHFIAMSILKDYLLNMYQLPNYSSNTSNESHRVIFIQE